jgi:cell division protein FtsB
MSPLPAQPSFLRRHTVKLFVAALLALGIHDIFGAHGYLAMRRSEKEIETLRGQIERLTQENQELASHVNALKTDPEAIEKIAREQMGLAKPGEMIFKLPAEPGADGKSAQPGNPH